MKTPTFRYEVLYRPGMFLSDDRLELLTEEIRKVASSCFSEIPEYQVLLGTRESYCDKVIAIAWQNGSIAGFCSSIVLDAKDFGPVLHLGLTCVRPESRNSSLTHTLTAKVIMKHMFHNRLFFRKTWITNCATVLGSLVNVYSNFEEVYPGPERKSAPDFYHKIASHIDRHCRDDIYINEDAEFDYNRFVFKRSVKNTVFEKDANDRRYHHRNEQLNHFYQNYIDFENGDEVLQVGYVGLLTPLRHLLKRQIIKPIRKMLTNSSKSNRHPDIAINHGY